MGERHAPLFHLNTCVLNLLFMFMAKAESLSIDCYLVGLENVACGSGIMKYLHNLVDH